MRTLSEEQMADARRLKNLWDARFEGVISQEEAAHRCGWKTQGAFNQYLNGKIPLALSALLKISRALKVDPEEISPRLSAEITTTTGKAYFNLSSQPYTPGLDSPPAGIPPEFTALLSKASPRSHKQLLRIFEAAADGRISEADINLINQIVERIATKE